MEQTQHTPGPWVFTPEVNMAGMRYVRQAPEANGSNEICRVEGWRDGIGEANARLIAAAPELLEALQKLVRAIDRMPSNPADGLADEARAAIAKATEAA